MCTLKTPFVAFLNSNTFRILSLCVWVIHGFNISVFFPCRGQCVQTAARRRWHCTDKIYRKTLLHGWNKSIHTDIRSVSPSLIRPHSIYNQSFTVKLCAFISPAAVWFRSPCTHTRSPPTHRNTKRKRNSPITVWPLVAYPGHALLARRCLPLLVHRLQPPDNAVFGCQRTGERFQNPKSANCIIDVTRGRAKPSTKLLPLGRSELYNIKLDFCEVYRLSQWSFLRKAI